MPQPRLGAFHHATLGVRSLAEASAFWCGHFGMTTLARRDGADAQLAALWDISPQDIAGQALVATPGTHAGALHLVEFSRPGPPVRLGAGACDLLPKNLDLYTTDMPARHAQLSAEGVRFRGPWAEMPGPGGLHFREVHLEGHDQINVVLIEIIGAGADIPLGPRQCAGIGPLVVTVPDVEREACFYRDVLGMDVTLDLQLAGVEVERTIGLPPGAGLDLRVFGDPAEPLGRIEVIEYRHARGENRHPRARPPATGILHVNYRIASLTALCDRLAAAGVEVTRHGSVATLCGTGTMAAFVSPAGFRIEVQETG